MPSKWIQFPAARAPAASAAVALRLQWLVDTTKCYEETILNDIPAAIWDPPAPPRNVFTIETPSWFRDVYTALTAAQLATSTQIAQQTRISEEIKANTEAAVKNFEAKPLSEGILSTLEPTGTFKDAAMAIEFIESINYALAAGYSKEKVMISVREAIRGQLARDWLISLSTKDRELIAESVTAWKDILRRDWVDNQPDSLMQAQAEYFDFAQGRSINEFVMHKLRLLNAVSGVKYDDTNLITQLHQSIRHDECRGAAD
ncbi:hypothetical protein TWF481_002733 [Arthrobotrys musiformis]|uniref:Uncharacterized protein n=1 Tax=Arthrobotrys musiformis TaxID=47236 RepID=A0AAV9VX82_9PEZI